MKRPRLTRQPRTTRLARTTRLPRITLLPGRAHVPRLTRTTRKTRLTGAVAVGVAAALTYGAVTTFATEPSAARPSHTGPSRSGRPAACAPPATTGPTPGRAAGPTAAPTAQVPPPLGPTTVTTLEQGYYCVFDHYYSGSQLDDRTLLVAAFAAFTKELRVLGRDQPNASMPALTGSRDKDWDAFAAVYSAVVNRLPADPALRQEVASATMQGMIGSLDDDHTRWDREAPNGGPFGLVLSDLSGDDRATPLVRGPLFVTSMLPGSPATAAGIAPGDEIAAVNGVPPFINGQLSQGVLDWLHAPKAPVKVTLHRPKDDTTFTVTLDPAGPRQSPPGGGSGSQPPPRQPGVTSRLLPGGLAYVLMPDFGSGRADQVLAAIAALRARTDLKGVVLDLRGNTGGDPAEDARLLGAWAHDTTWSYFCDVHGHCDPQRTDDSVPLLHLPLVALTDGNCASGCDAFAATVKDRHLGTLVGTRTAGVIAGPGTSYLLDDNSVLGLTQQRALMADKEIQSGIGTVPDHQAPLTAAALSAGRDPGVDKAVSLLTGGS